LLELEVVDTIRTSNDDVESITLLTSLIVVGGDGLVDIMDIKMEAFIVLLSLIILGVSDIFVSNDDIYIYST
jgi:hypothetical protein